MDRGLPDDVLRELSIWLAMPGFPFSYHAHVFGMDRSYVARFVRGYDQRQREVGDNWLSATRDDCIRLCRMRLMGGATC